MTTAPPGHGCIKVNFAISAANTGIACIISLAGETKRSLRDRGKENQNKERDQNR